MHAHSSIMQYVSFPRCLFICCVFAFVYNICLSFSIPPASLSSSSHSFHVDCVQNEFSSIYIYIMLESCWETERESVMITNCSLFRIFCEWIIFVIESWLWLYWKRHRIISTYRWMACVCGLTIHWFESFFHWTMSNTYLIGPTLLKCSSKWTTRSSSKNYGRLLVHSINGLYLLHRVHRTFDHFSVIMTLRFHLWERCFCYRLHTFQAPENNVNLQQHIDELIK